MEIEEDMVEEEKMTVAVWRVMEAYANGQRNFYNQDLRNQNFDGVNLQHASFYQCDFEGASFVGADLRWSFLVGTNFTNANLRDANMRWAAVEGATFTGACLDGVIKR